MNRSHLEEYSTKRKVALMINTANTLQTVGLIVWAGIVLTHDQYQDSSLRTGLILITSAALVGVITGYIGIILNNVWIVSIFVNLLCLQSGFSMGVAINSGSPFLWIEAAVDFIAFCPALWYWFFELYYPWIQKYKERMEREKLKNSTVA